MQTDPIRDKNKLRSLAGYFLNLGQFRNHTLIILGVHTALRISDLLPITWSDVYNEESDEFHSHIVIMEKKTGKQKMIALNNEAITALRNLLPHRRSKFIFENNRKKPAPISRVQAWRIIKSAAKVVGVIGCIACHSLRKTFGYHAWIAGTSPVVLMDIYNHSSYEITKRYLGVSQDDKDKAYMELALF